jgi:hypothetical protein
MGAIIIIVILKLPCSPIFNAHTTELGIALLLIVNGTDFITIDGGMRDGHGGIDTVMARLLLAIDWGEPIDELAVFVTTVLHVRVTSTTILSYFLLDFFLNLSWSLGTRSCRFLGNASCLGRSGLLS